MNGESVVSEVTINNVPYYALYFPIINSSGKPVTTAFLGLDESVRNNLLGMFMKITIPVILADLVIVFFVVILVVLRPSEEKD